MPGSAQPPYALSSPEFPFRALAALAGRAPLGGEREVSLAALQAARLASGAAPPDPLPQPVRARRAAAARAWFASLTLQTALRTPINRVVDATINDDPKALAAALAALIETAAPYLDAPAQQELRALSRAVAA
jgi:hypothetical protein